MLVRQTVMQSAINSQAANSAIENTYWQGVRHRLKNNPILCLITIAGRANSDVRFGDGLSGELRQDLFDIAFEAVF